MKSEYQALLKALGTKFVNRSIQTFDRATIVVVGVCWGAAILMIAFTVYTISLSASTRRAAEVATASEPVLPKIVRKPVSVKDAQPLVDRLQKRFPGAIITLNNDQTITLTASDGLKFREWLSAVSYIDVASPKYRWTIKEFCVGRCTGGTLMRALVAGETISFETKSGGDKGEKQEKTTKSNKR
ncbi:MAG: hypothetical protein AB7H77_03895 [Bdellovibrionales bacterium]